MVGAQFYADAAAFLADHVQDSLLFFARVALLQQFARIEAPVFFWLSGAALADSRVGVVRRFQRRARFRRNALARFREGEAFAVNADPVVYAFCYAVCLVYEEV